MNTLPQNSALANDYAHADEAIVCQIVENLPCPAFWKSLDHRFAGANRALADLLGLDSPSQLVGQSESDISLLCDAARLQTLEESILCGAPNLPETDTVILARHGEQIRIRTRRSVLRDSAGRPIGLLGTFTPYEDIERKKLRLQQAQMAARAREVDEDLENARQLQRYLLDQTNSSCPFLDIAWQYRFADKLGGDFVSLHPVGEDQFCFFLADLMGHGVSAALFTALLKYIAREASDAIRLHPEIFLSYLDQRFYDQIPNGFFTAIAGTFARDPLNGSTILTYANAAHPAAILVTAAGGLQLLRTETGAIGLMDDFERQPHTITLLKGDRLFLLTDGFEEAQNFHGEEFGPERIEQALATASHLSLSESIERLYFLCEGFRGPNRACDDMSILAFEAR